MASDHAQYTTLYLMEDDEEALLQVAIRTIIEHVLLNYLEYDVAMLQDTIERIEIVSVCSCCNGYLGRIR